MRTRARKNDNFLGTNFPDQIGAQFFAEIQNEIYEKHEIEFSSSSLAREKINFHNELETASR